MPRARTGLPRRHLGLPFFLALAAWVTVAAAGCAGENSGETGAAGGAGGSSTAAAGGQTGSAADAGVAVDAGAGRADGGASSSDARGDGGVGTASGGSRGAGGAAGTAGAGGLSGTGGRAGIGGTAGGGGPLAPVTIYIAGDSTVSNYPPTAANMQAGWGQMLPEYFTTQVTVSNQAIGGRTSRRFIEEGRLTTILDTIRPGDYLMVQFGTNDGNPTAVYPDGEPYLVSAADFQMFMMQFIAGARAKQATPILVTPPPRRSCTGDSHTFGNGLAGFATAMKTVAAQTGAALVDLNAKTLAYLDMIGCVASGDFFLLGDGTHFQVNGARIMAGFVVDGVRELALPLAAYEK